MTFRLEGDNGNMMEWASGIEEIWQYALLFVLAVAPWLDVYLVIPLGIAWGLSPALVAVVGFAGNFATVLLLGLFFRQFSQWREKRRQRKGLTAPSKKETRARQVWERYGLPVLALLGPIILGTDIAALCALTFCSSRTRVIVWMAVSLVLWSAALAVGAAYGFAYMNWIG